MRKIMMYLLTITLLMPCLAQDKFAKTADCETQHSTGSTTTRIFGHCTADPEIILMIKSKITREQCISEDGQVGTTTVHIRRHGKGVGTTTGNEYVLNSQVKSLSVGSLACGSTVTQTDHLVLISKGPLPNLKVIGTSTLTVDSRCDSHFTQTFEVVCQD